MHIVQHFTNRDLLCSTWNSAQGYLSVWMGGGFMGEWIQVYVWLSPHCSPETTTILSTDYTPIQNKKFKNKNTFSSLFFS